MAPEELLMRTPASLLVLLCAVVLAAACADPGGIQPPVATTLQRVGGDDQLGAAGETLADPVAVRVVDRGGQGVGGVSVAFVITGGGGATAASSVVSAADGRAETTWQLGEAAGENTLEARVSGLDGSPLVFRATGTVSDIVLTAVAPTPLIHGQVATLTGSGFSTTAGSNSVTIGGVAASVTAATETALEIIVPHTCTPAGDTDIRVAVGASRSNVLRGDVRPAQFLNVQPGQQQIVAGIGPTCLHFAASPGAEAYLVGVQSVSPVAGNVTSAVIAGATATLAAPGPLLATPGAAPTAAALLAVPRPSAEEALQQRLHMAAELRLRAWEREYFEPRMAQSLPARAAAAARGDEASAASDGVVVGAQATLSAAAVPATASVGDTVTVRVGNFSAGNLCQNFSTISAVVRVVGTRGIWIEDTANPAGGFTAGDFTELSTFFDTDVYPAIAGHFGAPTDTDGNGRVVIVATKEVNRSQGIGGFATTADLFPRAQCSGSNEGEYYYAQVPDPNGTVGNVAIRDNVLRNTKRLLPHEVTHIIQLGRRLQVPGVTAFQTTWELEGQATLAEEITGHRIAGRSTGQNYGQNVAWSSAPGSGVWWYQAFGYLTQYFGYESNTSRVAGAPEQCTFLGGTRSGNDGPCTNGNFNYYGSAWSFLRWLADQYGPTFAGGEPELHRLLIENPNSGFATIASVTGVPINVLLAEWAAMLYVDDRVATANPRLTMTSWNLADVFDSRVASARLQPGERGFANFTDEVTVRAGSTAYFRISGAARPATAVQVSDPAGNGLPSHMQVWVVRLQ
jgi:hypothetical protein